MAIIIIFAIIGLLGIYTVIMNIKYGHDTGLMTILIIICMGFINFGRNIRYNHKRYRKCAEIILKNREYYIEKIAVTMKLTSREVTKDILIMMGNDYLPEGEIDKEKGIVVIERTVKCKNCGAEYKLLIGLSNKCEYCGSIVKCE